MDVYGSIIIKYSFIYQIFYSYNVSLYHQIIFRLSTPSVLLNYVFLFNCFDVRRPGGIVITFSFLPFHRLWVNELGDPHFLWARLIFNIFMYHWQFFWALKDKRRRLKIHVSVYDDVPRAFQNVENEVKKSEKCLIKFSSIFSSKWRIYQVIMIFNVLTNWKVGTNTPFYRGL